MGAWLASNCTRDPRPKQILWSCSEGVLGEVGIFLKIWFYEDTSQHCFTNNSFKVNLCLNGYWLPTPLAEWVVWPLITDHGDEGNVLPRLPSTRSKSSLHLTWKFAVMPLDTRTSTQRFYGVLCGTKLSSHLKHLERILLSSTNSTFRKCHGGGNKKFMKFCYTEYEK